MYAARTITIEAELMNQNKRWVCNLQLPFHNNLNRKGTPTQSRDFKGPCLDDWILLELVRFELEAYTPDETRRSPDKFHKCGPPMLVFRILPPCMLHLLMPIPNMQLDSCLFWSLPTALRIAFGKCSHDKLLKRTIDHCLSSVKGLWNLCAAEWASPAVTCGCYEAGTAKYMGASQAKWFRKQIKTDCAREV